MKTSPNNKSFKLNPPINRLVEDMPKVGIRPTIDGRLQGVRESVEKTTMAMAQNVAKLIESTLRHSNGLPVECVIADLSYNRRDGGDTIFLVLRLKAFPSTPFRLSQSYNHPKTYTTPVPIVPPEKG